MSLPCDPEDCGERVSVTLIKSNTAAGGTCGQVNESQRGAESSADPSPPGRCGRRDEVERLSLPTGRADTLFKAAKVRLDLQLHFNNSKVPHPVTTI